jgi:signal transduction histidine kinase
VIRLPGYVRGFFGSLAGRIALLLTVGTAAAAILSLFAAEEAQKFDSARLRLEHAADSAADIAGRLRRNPVVTDRLLLEHRIWGARLATAGLAVTEPDPELTALLEQRFTADARPRGQEVPQAICFAGDLIDQSQRAAGMVDAPRADCWLVQYADERGIERTLTIDLPRFPPSRSSTLDPIYLLIVVAASAILSLLVARFATAPLRRLSRAAQAFSLSLDPEPIPERGPSEVQTALRTFNLMQRRVRDGFRERTHILAAISHDLQTPLTRLRLRLEQVADEALRDRLIADLAATQALVRDGLELARSSESREEWSIVDIDSLLASLAEDASEFGADVRFVEGCGASARVKPDGLTRCLSNLIDNAVKYGGGAELRSQRANGRMEISVRDHGPGIAPNRIEEMFEPFVRGEISRSRATGGTGIGLTIARAQAQTFGGVVRLENHPDGGLVAKLLFDVSVS